MDNDNTQAALKPNDGGRLLRLALRQRGLTQTEVAAKLGVTQTLLSNWVTGRKTPNEPQKATLLQLFGVPLDSWNRHVASTIEVAPLPLAVQQQLSARCAAATIHVAPVREAVESYARALEADAAQELLARLGLEAQPPHAPEAAAVLLRHVRSLPELCTADAMVKHAERLPVAIPPSTEVARSPKVVEIALQDDEEARALFDEVRAAGLALMPDDLFFASAEEYAARARIIQQRLGLRDVNAPEVRTIRYVTAGAHQRSFPRPIYGLARKHDTDWKAQVARAQSVRRAIESRVATGSKPPARPAVCDEPEVEKHQHIDLPHLRGQSILIHGCDRVDNQKLERLTSSTGVKLTWTEADNYIRAAERVRERRFVGIVFLEGRNGHRANLIVEVARQVDVPVEYGNKGGIRSILEALRALNQRIGQGAAA